MIREVIATGRDADTAIENGCRELGVAREEAEFEIISLPKKSFFGIKSHPAKVRVYVEIPDIVRTPREEPKPKAPREEREAGEKTPQQTAPGARQEATKPQQAARPPKPQQQREARPPKAPGEPPRERAPRQDRPRKEAPGSFQQEPVPLVEIEPDEKLAARVGRTAAYVESILTALGITELKIEPKYYTENVCLQLTGTGLGVIIGRRGETLDALQYLASLVANRGEDNYIRVNIDSGNYREKREKTLENLARKLANQAVRTGKSTTLEPMNPYERRVIHGAVSQIRGATSSSVGADPNRRVVISATGGAPKREGGSSGDRRPRSRGGRGRGGKEGAREGAPRPPKERQEKPAAVPQDLSDFSESIGTKLTPPPPPAPRPMPDDGQAPQAAPAPPREEQAGEPTPPPAPKPERKMDEQEVKEAPRYGKIEL